MSPEDRAFVVLADPAARQSLLADGGAQSVLDAAYGTAAALVEAPLQAVFDTFELGVSVTPELVDLSGALQDPAGKRTAVQLQAKGLHRERVVAEAFWRGSIVARSSAQLAPIVRVGASSQLEAVDLELEIGAPTDPATVDPVAFPIAVVFAVRRDGESLAELVARGRDARSALVQRGEAARERSGHALQHGVVIAAVLAKEFLEDPDWSGLGPAGTDAPADRRQHLRSLLAPQGIALLTL